MNSVCLKAAVAAAVILLSANSAALAHGLAGERFFPATILTDDPFVADEISLPQVTHTPPTPDGAQQTDIEIDWSKRITPHTDFIIGDQWQRLKPTGLPAVTGLGALRTAAQYQLFVNGPHQALGLVGLNVTWAHTGRVQALGAPDFTTLSPTFDFGKGFGEIEGKVDRHQRVQGEREEAEPHGPGPASPLPHSHSVTPAVAVSVPGELSATLESSATGGPTGRPPVPKRAGRDCLRSHAAAGGAAQPDK